MPLTPIADVQTHGARRIYIVNDEVDPLAHIDGVTARMPIRIYAVNLDDSIADPSGVAHTAAQRVYVVNDLVDKAAVIDGVTHHAPMRVWLIRTADLGGSVAAATAGAPIRVYALNPEAIGGGAGLTGQPIGLSLVFTHSS